MKKRNLSFLLICAILLAGCSTGNNEPSETDGVNNNTISTETDGVNSNTISTETENTDKNSVVISDMFTDRDVEVGYDESSSAIIKLNGNSASCDSSAVEISGNIVTITDEGTYILSGTLNDGMIVVNAEDTDKVQIVLNGVDITNSTSAAIYVLEADKVFLTTSLDSSNTLSNGGEYVAIDKNNIDAVIFSKADLTLNGEGSLTIKAPVGHGIVSKDDLVLTSGKYDITAKSHGISGKNSVRIANGTYRIVSEKDGIHAENADDTSLGFVYIANGTFNITAAGDGISGGTYLQVENGDFTIEAGGGSKNASTHSIQSFERGDIAQTTSSTDDSVSTKGIKAVSNLVLNGGIFVIDSADDGLHSNSNVTINAGSFQITTGDDGIHADAATTISGGVINITQSYEGIEGKTIDITGGDISLVASDDGLNAAGGNDSSGFGNRGDQFAASSDVYIAISGGVLHVDASGDGIDSNGNLYVSGGETYVSGPTNSGNGSLDYNGEASITGGIFVAAGMSGMAQNFSSSSTQGAMLVFMDSGSAGSNIILTDANGKELVSWQAVKAYESVLISCPELTQGSTYTLTTGDTSTQITMSSLIYGSGDMNPGGMGTGGRGPGGMGGGGRRN